MLLHLIIASPHHSHQNEEPFTIICRNSFLPRDRLIQYYGNWLDICCATQTLYELALNAEVVLSFSMISDNVNNDSNDTERLRGQIIPAVVK